MEVFLSCKQIITRSYLKTTVVCLLISFILSILPVCFIWYFHDSSCSYVPVDNYGPVLEKKSNYCLWSLIAVITTIPMLCDIMLDLPSYLRPKELHNFCVYQLLLLVFLVAPSLSMYMVLTKTEAYEIDNPFLRSLFYSVSFCQICSLFSIIQVTLFCSKWTNNDNEYKVLKKVFVLKDNKTFYVITEVFSYVNTAVSYFCIISMIYYLSNDFVYGKYNLISYQKLSDVLHSIIVIGYDIGLYAVDIFFFNDVYILWLYLQIALTLLLTIVPSQINLLRAETYEAKSKLKLNTIRYVSHEMRTPLNISLLGSKLALGNLKKLLNKLEEMNIDVSSAKQVIENTNDEIVRLKDHCNTAVGTLDDVLTFDKLDEHKLALEKQIVCPLELLRDVMKPLEEKTKSRNIVLRLVCLPANNVSWLNNFELSCDRAKISYLITNALKYTSSECNGHVTVFLEKIDDSIRNSTALRICVRDTGQGIPKKNQASIFTLFTDSETAAEDDSKSGLGLWISKKIVELHEGSISLFSLGLGYGTTFTIELPTIPKLNEVSSTKIHPRNDSFDEHTFGQQNFNHADRVLVTFLYHKYFMFGGVSYYFVCGLVLCLLKIYLNYPKLDLNDDFLNADFPEWSIASLLLLVPLVIYNIIDVFRKPVSWIDSTALTVGLVFPSVVSYFMWHSPNFQYERYGAIVQSQLDLFQLMIVNTCLLSLTFLSTVDTSNDAYFSLKSWISNIVPVYVIVIIFSKTFFVLGTLINYALSTDSNVYYYISYTLDILASAVAIYCYAKLILHHYQCSRMTMFESHNQLRDILHSSVLCVYLLASHLTFDFEGMSMYLKSVYYLFLMIVVLFLVIPNRVNIFHVQSNQMKLAIQEKLICHLSQQMGGPIKQAISSAYNALLLIEDIRKSTSEYGYDRNIEMIIRNSEEVIREIHESCKVSEMTLEDLFILNQMQDQKLKIDMEIADPWILVQSVASPFSVVAKSTNICFRIENSLSSRCPVNICLHCDKFKISQVIRNLISNALKFTPAGGEVSLMLEYVEDSLNSNQTRNESTSALQSDPDQQMESSAGTIRITVRDSGAGISLENQNKLFVQYVQFNAAQLQNGNGSGLGLWISKNIVELHEGDITAYSAGEGYGTTFTLNLPAHWSSIGNHENSLMPSNNFKDLRYDFQFHSSDDEVNYGRDIDDEIVISSKTIVSTRRRSSKSSRKGGSSSRKNSGSSSKRRVSDGTLIRDSSNTSFSSKQISSVNDIFSNEQFSICRDKLESINVSEKGSINSVQSSNRRRSKQLERFSSFKGNASEKSSLSHLFPEIKHDSDMGSKTYCDDVKSKTTSIDDTEGFTSHDDSDPSNILVVDDSAATRKMLSRLLTPLGFTVSEAKDGWQCLEKCRCPMNISNDVMSVSPFVYDAILIDDSMPNMHGPEAVSILRHYGYHGLILGLTGSVDNVTKLKFKSSGADDVLTKPLDTDKLIKLLVKIV